MQPIIDWEFLAMSLYSSKDPKHPPVAIGSNYNISDMSRKDVAWEELIWMRVDVSQDYLSVSLLTAMTKQNMWCSHINSRANPTMQ